MDYMCVRSKKVEQLQIAAKLSTVQLVECDEYIRLAMCVEQYINNPSDDQFQKLKAQLAICTEHFPTFNQSRQMLIATLLNTGHMIKDVPTEQPEPSIEEKSPPLQPTVQKSNVVNIFSKKHIDK